ncbi:MAG: HAD family hydrolase [Candidatus Lokiarchaeota archaeon]|nr:HAD family hydrolase [Candidatus Lokiarchaeota archaeon]
MLPKGILFDLDDTITTFDTVVEPSWKKVCNKYANQIDNVNENELYLKIIETANWYWSDKKRHEKGRLDIENARRRILELTFNKIKNDDISLAHEIADSYSRLRVEAIDFYPGAEETLKYLYEQGVSLGLVTNGQAEKQREKIERFRLERFFSSILIEGELGYGKPNEAVYLRALDEIGLNAGSVWFVGDNLEWDVEAPQKLGIYSIWNDYRKQGLPLSSNIIPDRIITNISELIAK